MFKKFLVIAMGSMFALSAFAVDMSTVKESIPLKDGSMVYVFKDGKMGMEDKAGRPARMKAGQPMDTKDGKRVVMVGDEVIRMDSVLGRGWHTNQ